MRKKFRRNSLILVGLFAVVATVVMLSPPGRQALGRLTAKQESGQLQQAVWLVVGRSTLGVRQMLAATLGFRSRSSLVDDSRAREELPEFVTIPGASVHQLTPGVDLPAEGVANWHHSFGDNSAAKFSRLSQISRSNVGRLSRIWSYEGEGQAKNIQATPIYTGQVVVFPDTSDRIVALNPASGSLVWTFDPGIPLPARRGLVFVQGASPEDGKIFFTAGGRLFGIWAKDGNPIESFNGGSVVIGFESRVAPMIAGNWIVVASFKPAIHVFDISSGRLVREVDYLSAFESRSWLARLLSGDPHFGGANPWGGIAIDNTRRLAYVSTSNPGPIGVGINRHGDNMPTVSVVAIALETGKVIWAFQDVRHDLWDLDIASPPVLTTISREGKRLDVVAAATKSGHVLLLDRVSGVPVFDFRLRRAPASGVPGERTSAYQPDPLLPEPFGRVSFTLEDVTDIGARNHESVLAQLDRANMGFYPPHEIDVTTVFFGLHGGSMHYGACLDQSRGVMFVAASHVPSMFTITASSDAGGIELVGDGVQPYRERCAICHGHQADGRGEIPSLNASSAVLDVEAFRSVVKSGVRGMPPITGISNDEITSVYNMLVTAAAERSRRHAVDSLGDDDDSGDVALRRTTYMTLRDFEGYPGSKPPWGTLTAIDLNTGRHLWRVPLGRYDELIARGIPQTGTENISGPMVTSGGVVFVSGTKDRLIRAFDSTSGEELWEAELPFIGTSSPMTYMHDGLQYIVVSATGGGTLGLYDTNVRSGKSFVAFALPR